MQSLSSKKTAFDIYPMCIHNLRNLQKVVDFALFFSETITDFIYHKTHFIPAAELKRWKAECKIKASRIECQNS